MESLPNKIYLSIIDFKNKYPTLFVTLVFIIILGLFLPITLNFTNSKLRKSENNINSQPEKTTPLYYEGRVYYVGKKDNKPEFGLKDLNGNSIALLRSNDERLQVLEGLYVKIYGDLIKGSQDKPNTIIVKEVIIQNVSN